MKELKPRIHENGMDYVLVGDYYVPDLKLPEERRPIGHWGRLHQSYLKLHRPMLYNELILSGSLHTVVADLNEQAADRLDLIIRQMMKAEGETDALKAENQLFCLNYSTVERGKAMILEAMYNGEFYPCETVVPTSPEYRKAVIACEKLMEQLSQRLSKEDYELVQELRAQTAIAQCEESESHFKYGFSAGLMFSRKPMFLCCF